VTFPARCLALVAPLLLATASPRRNLGLPEDHRKLARTISFAGWRRISARWRKGPGARVGGGTNGAGPGRLPRPSDDSGPGTEPAWKVLFYAQQHGDEISGKDALLYLVRKISREPTLLPPDVDLWILPMMNPDGAESGTRRNAAGADLNRDHIVLEQPETQALHRVVRRLRPHLAVDAHEFSRDPKDWRARGWLKWPDITMDGLNNPLFDGGVVAAARRWSTRRPTPRPERVTPFSATGWATRLRTASSGIRRPTSTAASTPSECTAVSPSSSKRPGSRAPTRRRGPRQPRGRLPRPLPALHRRERAPEGGPRCDRTGPAKRLPGFLPVNYLWVNPAATVTEFRSSRCRRGGSSRFRPRT